MSTVTAGCRSMIKNSKEWAKQRVLLEVNEIHGEEEWRIPVSRDFTVSNGLWHRVKDYCFCGSGCNFARKLTSYGCASSPVVGTLVICMPIAEDPNGTMLLPSPELDADHVMRSLCVCRPYACINPNT